jgi:hypothetical protein
MTFSLYSEISSPAKRAGRAGLRPSRVGVGRTLAVLWLAPDPAAKRKRRRRKAFARKRVRDGSQWPKMAYPHGSAGRSGRCW